MNPENLNRSAIAPVGIVAVASMNTSWKKKNARIPTSYACPVRKKPECEMTCHSPRWAPLPSGVIPNAGFDTEPNINAYPHTNHPTVPNAKMTRFIIIVCAAFLARVNPVSTSAKPACMKRTKTPPVINHV